MLRSLVGSEMCIRDRFLAAVNVADESLQQPWVHGAPVGVVPEISDGNPVQYTEAGTFRVPLDRESLNWEQLPTDPKDNRFPFRFDSELLWWKVHMHWSHAQDLWVVLDASPIELGLGHAPFIQHRTPCTLPPDWPYPETVPSAWPGSTATTVDEFCDPSQPLMPMASNTLTTLMPLNKTNTNLTIDALKSKILRALASHQAKTGRGTLLLDVPPMTSFAATLEDQTYWSRPLVKPALTQISAGSSVTTIGFYGPQHQQPNPPDIPAPQHTESTAERQFRMHTKVWGYLKPSSPLVRWWLNNYWAKLARYHATFFPVTTLLVVLALWSTLLLVSALLLWRVLRRRQYGQYSRVSTDADPTTDAASAEDDTLFLDNLVRSTAQV
eukprot:TRINITY_DN5309_c0_g2_i1.p1 TRINITY_DN5309_c0_g2~~TRINITY_DN5309_c0_g2_i1.p1  ORF type:complete len:383 (+),score=53.12 TRINITY_DN5309_c0_g2_i1:105-1253(+)